MQHASALAPFFGEVGAEGATKSRAGPQLGIHQASKSKQSGRLGLRNCAPKTGVSNGSHSPASLLQVSWARDSYVGAMRLNTQLQTREGTAALKENEAFPHHSAGFWLAVRCQGRIQRSTRPAGSHSHIYPERSPEL
ncbi:unnamed protein product [Symbiodinium natans]|uniref:Uncharacterized protein n=1 Tax=Symbiodinium natans TaxID=878477 RepID=A0A812RIV5_9DINO|nr:unnamed protein product [Symbiodinium natans]